MLRQCQLVRRLRCRLRPKYHLLGHSGMVRPAQSQRRETTGSLVEQNQLVLTVQLVGRIPKSHQMELGSHRLGSLPGRTRKDIDQHVGHY
jgi:hypothetical protein